MASSDSYDDILASSLTLSNFCCKSKA